MSGAKRSLFNRPKWAASGPAATKASSASPVKGDARPDEGDDFFSRSTQTFDSVAAEEEERIRQRAVRKAAEKAKAETPTPVEPSPPSSKKRRLSIDEKEILDGDVTDSSLEGEGVKDGLLSPPEEGLYDGDVKKPVAKKEEQRRLNGKTTSLELLAAGPSSNLLQLPSDEQCERVRKKNKNLASLSNDQIRELARLRWERERGEQGQDEQPELSRSPAGKHLKSSGGSRGERRLRSRAQAEPTEDSRELELGSQKAPVSLDDDEDDTNTAIQQSVELTTPTQPPEHLEEDDEFADLAREAREKARRKRLQEEVMFSPPLDSDNNGSQQMHSFSSDAFVSQQQLGRSTSQTPTASAPSQPPDPIIQFLITSSIPNTQPLVVSRRLSQRMKEMRQFWCGRNNLSAELADRVVLTWRRRRLFNFTTSRDLGFTVDEYGNLTVADDGGTGAGGDDFQGKIHLVAMTEEEFERLEQGRSPLEGHASADGSGRVEAAPDRSGSVDAPTQGQTQGQQDPAPPPPAKEIRIILQSRGHKEQKLIVRPTTEIQRIVSAFRQENKISARKSVALMFDGELLQPNSTVAQTDIDDLDHIDVHVR